MHRPAPLRHLSRLLALGVVGVAGYLLTACSSVPPYTSSSAAPAAANEVVARLTPEQATEVTLYAISLVGTPYRFGGNTPDSGFDCSGLIAYVYRTHASLHAPRTVQALNDWGTALPAHQLRSGDLVLFSGNGVATHAGIYVGEGRFVHAPSTGGEVRLDSLQSSYWSRLPASFRRP